MPLYMCNAAKGAISAEAKSKIAADVTRIHCEVTGAPATFVHVFFFEEAEHMPLDGHGAVLFGTIRGGRTDAQKVQMKDEMQEAIRLQAGVPQEKISVLIAETPANWVMEGGDLLPEPGEEAEWLKAHEAKVAEARTT